MGNCINNERKNTRIIIENDRMDECSSYYSYEGYKNSSVVPQDSLKVITTTGSDKTSYSEKTTRRTFTEHESGATDSFRWFYKIPHKYFFFEEQYVIYQ